MSAISKYLRSAGGNGQHALVFWCPGCNSAHAVAVQRPADQPGPTWGWNGNPHKPTFTPSIFVKTVRHDMTDADWVAYDAAMAQGDQAINHDADKRQAKAPQVWRQGMQQEQKGPVPDLPRP